MKSTTPGLSHEEQSALCLIAQGRTPGSAAEAEARLLAQYAGLLWRLARRIPPATLDPDDALQEARVGFLQAIRAFNPERGARLSTYVQHCVTNRLWRALSMSSSTIRLPSRIYLALRRADEVAQELEARLLRAPNDEELAGALEMSEEELRDLRLTPREPLSLDAPVMGQSGDYLTPGEVIPDPSPPIPDAVTDLDEHRRILDRASAKLSHRERDLIARRYGLPPYRGVQSLQAVADAMGLSRQSVYNAERRVLMKMREAAKDLEPVA